MKIILYFHVYILCQYKFTTFYHKSLIFIGYCSSYYPLMDTDIIIITITINYYNHNCVITLGRCPYHNALREQFSSISEFYRFLP